MATHVTEDWSFCDIRWVAQQLEPSYQPLSVRYLDIRSRQLEGTYPGDPMAGTWPLSAARIGRGWGYVLENEWPQAAETRGWPPPEPPGLDERAKPRRCHHYQRIRSLSDCMVMLGHGFPVSASFEITAQWLDAPHGAIRLPKPDEEIIGSHCVGIVGFDLIHRFFRFENSWGGDWGDAGYGYLPFEYFDKYLVSSWLPHGIGKFPDYYRVSGVAELVWGVPDFLGHTLHGGDIIHGREVYDGANDERLGWAFAVHREGYLDVEEIFVRPQFRKAGVANRLVSMLLELAGDVNRPLRLWVPFADWTASNSSGVEKIVGKLGLRLHETNVRWAAAVAIAPGVPPPASPSSVVPQAKFASHPVPPGSVALSKRTPKRPAKCRPGRSALPAGEPRRDRYPLRGKPVRYVDPTSPVAESEWESPR